MTKLPSLEPAWQEESNGDGYTCDWHIKNGRNRAGSAGEIGFSRRDINETWSYQL